MHWNENTYSYRETGGFIIKFTVDTKQGLIFYSNSL